MRYRKFKADYLFTGKKMLKDENILVTDENGKIIHIIPASDAGDDIETFEGVLSPGFINAHCHTELSHLKNRIPEKTGLVNFLFKVVSERHFDENEILVSIERAENEMRQNGIVAVGDICNNSLSALQKKKNNLRYYNFIETTGWLPSIAKQRFEKSKSIYDEFLKDHLISSIVPHAPYSVSENLWKEMIPSFKGKTISIHNQESADEDLFFLEGKGTFTRMYQMMNIDNSFYEPRRMRSIQSYFKNVSSAASVILVHNTFTNQDDLNFINQHKNPQQLISFCLCPNANLYIENTLPPIDLFLKDDLQIILGTDSLASNHQLDILEEIKTIRNYYPGIKTETLLRWATLNGAMALQMDHESGSFDDGKIPGVILIEHTKEGEITDRSQVRRII